MHTQKKRRGGPPKKAPDGLQKVLYVRVAPDLLHALDTIAQRQREDNPGLTVSRSDVARQLLYEAALVEKP